MNWVDYRITWPESWNDLGFSLKVECAHICSSLLIQSNCNIGIIILADLDLQPYRRLLISLEGRKMRRLHKQPDFMTFSARECFYQKLEVNTEFLQKHGKLWPHDHWMFINSCKCIRNVVTWLWDCAARSQVSFGESLITSNLKW